jgi:glycosyltransferase involved in cell wall biosynthesis
MEGYRNIAILIPAYNEDKYIKHVIENCAVYGMDIIVVDDGSVDSTAAQVRLLIKEAGNKLKLITHPYNMGKGRALITGFSYIIKKKYMGVITIDADGQHDTAEIKKFVETVKDKDPDLIIGNRLENTLGMPFIRLATNVFTSWIISRIADKKISDVQSGYRYLKTSAIKKIKLNTCNFDTEPEIVMRAGWYDMKILNIPIKTIYHKDFVSHVNPIKDTLKFFRLVINGIREKKDFKNAAR